MRGFAERGRSMFVIWLVEVVWLEKKKEKKKKKKKKKWWRMKSEESKVVEKGLGSNAREHQSRF